MIAYTLLKQTPFYLTVKGGSVKKLDFAGTQFALRALRYFNLLQTICYRAFPISGLQFRPSAT